MLDRNGSDKPQDRKDSSKGDKPKGGGFGAFSEVYRARWAANHPDMQRQWPADDLPPPLTPPEGADAEADAKVQPRSIDPMDPERR